MTREGKGQKGKKDGEALHALAFGRYVVVSRYPLRAGRAFALGHGVERDHVKRRAAYTIRLSIIRYPRSQGLVGVDE